jgi:hypothetical protein
MAVRMTALTVAVASVLAGCAQDGLTPPSFAGLSDVGAASEMARGEFTTDVPVDPALRHVNTNRVLGAMAYQKVTGRSVDPARLIGSD